MYWRAGNHNRYKLTRLFDTLIFSTGEQSCSFINFTTKLYFRQKTYKIPCTSNTSSPSQGYLKHFIESVGADNHALIAGLSTHNVKPLFIYEAKLVRMKGIII